MLRYILIVGLLVGFVSMLSNIADNITKLETRTIKIETILQQAE